jgi:hypothetical protein
MSRKVLEKKRLIDWRDPSKFSPLTLWLHANGKEDIAGYKFKVAKKPKSINELILKIQLEIPDFVLPGLRCHGLYDTVTRRKIEDPRKLVDGRCYLVTCAYQPDWDKFEPHKHETR